MDIFSIDACLIVAGILVVLRQLSVILSADRGRKQDLVKKIYRASHDFQISVLVPYLNPQQYGHLMQLLDAIDHQEYPASRVAVHIVATEQAQADLAHERLKPNVRLWGAPKNNISAEQATAWLIERCLAQGGAGIMVFLKPDDIVKPDFFRNIVSRSVDSFAIQGYVALKDHPDNPVEKVFALTRRLANRIGNAGRYHLGLSCRLQDTGWAIKQEVLEMIPYHARMDLDNLEYTIRLNLENFRVTWAPNVVVYSDDTPGLFSLVTRCVGAAVNRVRMLLQYGPRLVAKALLKMDFSYLETVFAIVRPPAFFVGLALAVLAGVATLQQTDPAGAALGMAEIPGTAAIWWALAGTVLILETLSLGVARCAPVDYVTLFFWTPVVYTLGILALPVGIFNYVAAFFANRQYRRPASYRHLKTTRFNEDMAPEADFLSAKPSRRVIEEILEQHAPDEYGPAAAGSAQRDTRTSSRMTLPKEHVKIVPLSNGKKQVNCTLKTVTTYDESGREQYQLTLEYKTHAFSTASYRILDQAFYELQSKLMARGFTIVTCGSCGYFYNPTADVPGAIRNRGVCLFGKEGRDVNLDTDAVTVISQSCEYHASMASREKVVNRWKDSLARERTRSTK